MVKFYNPYAKLMFLSLKTIFYLVRLTLKAMKNYGVDFTKQYDEFCKNYPDEAQNIDLKRVIKYYNILLCIVGEMFARLQKVDLKDQDFYKLKNAGILATLVDELMDNKYYEKNNRHQLFTNPHNFEPHFGLERLILRTYHNLSKEIEQSALTKDYLMKAKFSQEESINQRLSNLCYEQIKRISIEKGGYSFVFVMTLLPLNFEKKYIQLYYIFGAILQYTNDIYDYYIDIRDQQKTPITAAQNLQVAYQDFQQLCVELMSLLKECSSDPKRYNQAKGFMLLAVSITVLAFEEMIEMENRFGVDFKAGNLPRKTYIIDMELLSNKFKLMKIFISHPFLKRLSC